MIRKPAASTEMVAVCSSLGAAIALGADGQLPTRIQIMAMGDHRPRNGTPPRVLLEDRVHAEAVASASNAYRGPNAMVVDYDHQTVRAPAVGGRAEAAAWIGKIVVDDDGLWGEDIEWTAQASAALADKRYRYVSPYFAHRPDGRVTRIFNVGLTNTPNLDLAAVASAMTEEEDSNMIDLKALASALGLGEDADEAAIMAAIARNKAAGVALTATASALGVQASDDLAATATAIGAAVNSAKPDPSKFVPVATVAEMQATMSTMQGQIAEFANERKSTMIDAAIKSGRLIPALKAHAEGLEETALASFLAAMPETGLGKAQVPGGQAGQGDTLSDEERAVASAWGLTPEEFLKSRKQMEAN